MDRIYIEDKVFDKTDFTVSAPSKAEYDNCRFINCNFSNTDLSEISFADCEFNGCNLVLAKLHKTAFKNVKFIDSKLTGLHFDQCSDFNFSVYFENCLLNLAVFYKMKLRKTVFRKTILHESDFTEADLSNASFDSCDLMGVIFDNTNLEKADLRTSFNYTIDPALNKIKKAKFSTEGLAGLLSKYDIEID